MRSTAKKALLSFVAGALVLPTLLSASPAKAGLHVELTGRVSQPVDIRVWLEQGSSYTSAHYEYEVYPTAADVVVNVRTARSCYATVYLVDTAGYIHIVHPFGPHGRAWLRGGRVYRFRLGDYGFCEPWIERGIAFVFAVSSPVPFDYSCYGAGFFDGDFTVRIHGDPYVACKRFYLSMIPQTCRASFIRVSHARFYVGAYVRYPGYLCPGWHEYYGVRHACQGQCAVYRYYRMHARDPYRVLSPEYRIRESVGTHTQIARVSTPHREMRPQSDRSGENRTLGRGVTKNVLPESHSEIGTHLQHRPTGKIVVRASSDSAVEAKKNLSDLRRALENRDRNSKSVPQEVRVVTVKSGRKEIKRDNRVSTKSHKPSEAREASNARKAKKEKRDAR